jgi:eukaryotic translation initiation factor 2C
MAKGTKVVLTTNYVELLPASNMILHRYDMDITPDATGRKRHWVVQLLLQLPELAPQKGSLATDFKHTIIAKTKFKRDEDIIEIQYRSEGEDEPATGATVYKIHVQYTKILSVGGLIDWMNSTNIEETFGDKPQLIQALNIFLNHYVKSTNNTATIGKSKAF